MPFSFRDSRKDRAPKRYWNAAESFVDLKLSHWIELALTASLIGVGVLQYLVYHRQATDSELEARSFLSVTDVSFYKGKTRDQGGYDLEYVTVSINNSGNTPASNVTYREVQGIVEGGPNNSGQHPYDIPIHPSKPVQYPDASGDIDHFMEELPKGIIAPHFALIGAHASQIVQNAAVDLLDFKSGKRHYYLSGIVTYDDIYGEHHTTKWCYKVAIRQVKNDEEEPFAAPCTHWNCADSLCKSDSATYYQELNTIYKAAGFAVPKEVTDRSRM